MNELSAPPARLVQDGQWRFGMFNAPIEGLNALDTSRPFGVPMTRSMKSFRLKEWQAFQFGNGRHFFNIALFDAKWLALVQIKVFDRQTGQKVVFEKKVLPSSMQIANGLNRGVSRYDRPGCAMIFDNRWKDGTIQIDMNVAPTGSFAGIKGRLIADCTRTEPLVVSMPFAKNRGMYSQKAMLPLVGELSYGADSIPFESNTGYLMMDDHKGYYPHTMKWDWLTAAGIVDGRRIGFNLTRNQTIAPELLP
ncbi:MAG: DUF2804 family protein [Polyangiales bacterium]